MSSTHFCTTFEKLKIFKINVLIVRFLCCTCRNVINVDEEVSEIAGANQDAFRSIEESGGWRSTRNCYQISLSDEDPHLSLGNDINACSETKHNQHKLLRRENGTNAQSHDHYPNCEDLSSNRYPSARNSSQVARPLGQQISHIDVHHPMITPLGKRQKQGSTSINNAECSTSAFNDTDIIFRDSYRDPNNNSRENTNQNCSRSDNLESIIHIDDSPQATNDGSKGVACCRSDEDARARQVEADEALALELQEQLFNETPVFGVDNEVVSLFPLFLLSIHQVHVGNGLWLNWSKPPPSPLMCILEVHLSFCYALSVFGIGFDPFNILK